MSQLKTMTQKWFEEMETFELPTVVRECPTEAAEAVTDLRKEVRALQAELTKERENVLTLKDERDYARQQNEKYAEALKGSKETSMKLANDLSKEREDNRQLCEELEFIRPMVSLNIHDEEGNEPNEG